MTRIFITIALFVSNVAYAGNDILLEKISNKYKAVPTTTIHNIVEVADRLEYRDFPTKYDILALISIESGFKRSSVSPDGSRDLMQIHYRKNRKTIVNNFSQFDSSDLESHMRLGVIILRSLYESLGSPRAALLAYNSGIGNYQKGRYNPTYYTKFKLAKSYIQTENL